TTSNPNSNCVWTMNGSSITGDCNGFTTTLNQAGCYDVELQVTDNNNCVSTLLKNDIFCIEPSVFANFQITQPNSTTMQTHNHSVNAVTYEWILPNGTTTEFEPTITYSVIGSQSITLYAYSNSGCVDSLTIPIEWPLSTPNIITANGDGVNDFFIIAGISA